MKKIYLLNLFILFILGGCKTENKSENKTENISENKAENESENITENKVEFKNKIIGSFIDGDKNDFELMLNIEENNRIKLLDEYGEMIDESKWEIQDSIFSSKINDYVIKWKILLLNNEKLIIQDKLDDNKITTFNRFHKTVNEKNIDIKWEGNYTSKYYSLSITNNGENNYNWQIIRSGNPLNVNIRGFANKDNDNNLILYYTETIEGNNFQRKELVQGDILCKFSPENEHKLVQINGKWDIIGLVFNRAN
jgi:hypothetical protein